MKNDSNLLLSSVSVVIIAPNIGMGGVERASCTIANAFSSLGHIVSYLALIPETPFFKLDAEVSYTEPVGFNMQKMDIIRTIRYIRKEIQHQQPVYILAYTKFYAALSNIALVGSKYGVVVTERSSPLFKWPWHIEFFCWLSFTLKKPVGIISQTTIANEYHRRYYQGIPNVVIPNPVREVEKYPGLKRKNWILAVGRFHDECKGFDLLVQAFNLIKNNDWRLVFAGGNRVEGQYLLDQAANREKADKIDFIGVIQNIDEIYAQAGIFVMPSRKEGFPNALCEAMSSGCPCISFDFTAGPRDIITDNEDGIIVKDGSIYEMAEAIDKLIEEPKLRKKLGDAAEHTGKRLSLDVISKQYWDFLTQSNPSKK